MRHTDEYRYDVMRDNQEQIVMLHVQNELAPQPNQHFHNSMEFVYVAEGRICARLGSNSVKVEKGELLALPSFLPHDFPRKDAELWQLIVPRSLMGNLDKLMEHKTLDRLVIADSDGQLLTYMRLIYDIYTRRGAFAALDAGAAQNAANTAASNFVRVVIALCGLREATGSSTLVMQAIRYLSEHFREPVRVGEISQKLYCNRSQLSALFWETFGLSMNEYITRLRAAEVRRLLTEETNITLAEACSAAGFGSLRTLHRAYKEIYGCAPCASVDHPSEQT